jgi:hypothetical protein
VQGIVAGPEWVACPLQEAVRLRRDMADPAPFSRAFVRLADAGIWDEANANITSIRRCRAGAVNAKRSGAQV